VVSTGGRYRYEDDWEFWDIQNVGLEYPGRKSITWEGHSVDQVKQYGLDRGSLIFGDDGHMLIDPGFYRIYDHDLKVIKEVKAGQQSNVSATNTRAPTADITKLHCQNFIECVRGEAKPNSEISGGHKSVLMCHLGNIAQQTQQSLKIDPKNGHILDNPEAEKMWARTYEPGWEPTI